MTTVLLTGAAGKVGKHAIGALSRRDLEVVATDIASDGIPEGVRHEPCDLTDASAVDRMVARVKPDVVVHGAAVVAPIAYAEPELAEAVNLDGTRHLLDSIKMHAPDAFFAFVSSYAVFGPACPGAPDRGADDPSVPADNYGRHKRTAETWVRESGLRQCSLRLGAVMDMGDLVPGHWSYKPFMFMVPLDQPEHGVDVRDAARAIAAAAVRQADQQLFLIGGDDSWKVSARTLRTDLFAAMGLPMPPDEAFRCGMDPTTPDGWFYECWMEVRASQRALDFQTISRPMFVDELHKRYRLRRMGATLLRPLIAQAMRANSPYVGKTALTPGATLLDDLGLVYGLRSQGAKEPMDGSSTFGAQLGATLED